MWTKKHLPHRECNPDIQEAGSSSQFFISLPSSACCFCLHPFSACLLIGWATFTFSFRRYFPLNLLFFLPRVPPESMMLNTINSVIEHAVPWALNVMSELCACGGGGGLSLCPLFLARVVWVYKDSGHSDCRRIHWPITEVEHMPLASLKWRSNHLNKPALSTKMC